MKYLLTFFIILSLVILIPHAFAQESTNIPAWIKNNAGWWASDLIDDSAFLQGIQYIIKEGIMVIPQTETVGSSQTDQAVPVWVKNTAGWWATDAISETEFVNGLQYLIKVGIMIVPEAEKVGISTVKISGYPDWLINNPSWQTAREFTNSPFDNFDIKYVKEKPTGAGWGDIKLEKKLNSRGFSGPEFSSIKPPDTYRIFTLGGSTTFGTYQDDNETWPAYLQQLFDGEELGAKVEVINVGTNHANSTTEYQMTKTRLVDYQPDLIIMYDGWNDLNHNIPVDVTVQNWKSFCKLGNEKGFETIIIIQPLIGTGNRVHTDYEFLAPFVHLEYTQNDSNLERLDLYVENIQLNKSCTVTADFRGIFDYTEAPIYFDLGHTTVFGNKVIAESVFAISAPIVSAETNTPYEAKTHFPTYDYTPNANQFTIYAVGADFSGRSFDGLDLRNAIFDNADLSNISLKSTKLVGARFANADLLGTSLSGYDLTNTNFVGVDLSGKDLTGTILTGTNLSNADLSGVNLSGKDLTGTILTGANLSNADLSGVDLSGKDLSNADLSGVDLSGKDLTGTILTGANLSNADLSGVDLSGKDLTNADLSGVDLSGKDLTGTILTGANLSNADLSGVDLSGKDLTGTIIEGINISGIDLTGNDLSDMNLTGINLDDIDLAGKDLSYSILIGVDLSGKDLTGTILTGTNLSNADLSGVNLSGKDLIGTILTGANLSNADLSGVDLSGKDLSNVDLTETDLTDTDLSQATLYDANLSGLNLTGTKLVGVNLEQANLSNANLSGIDISSSSFKAADLSHANLSYSDLSKSELTGASLINTDIRFTDFTNSALFEIDFTKIKNKNWDGTIISKAGLIYANLVGMDFSGKDLTFTVFKHAKLNGANFSNDVILHGTNFILADLEGTNFEGANLSPKQTFNKLFKNKAHLSGLFQDQLTGGFKLAEELLHNHQSFASSAEVRGNDLFVEYFLFCNFNGANLENTNFVNTELWASFFVNAFLPNAVLSGADLTGANLTNADLDGADLNGAILDGAVLNCKNHSICN